MTTELKFAVILYFNMFIHGHEINVYPKKYSQLGSIKHMAEIVDTQLQDNVYLYCGEFSEGYTWLYRQRGCYKEELQNVLEIRYKYLNNIKISLDKTLIITSFGLNNSGIYVCKRDNGVSVEENMYTYVVDAVFKDIPKISGTFEQFEEFKSKEIDSINEMFENSNLEPFTYFSKAYKFSFRLVTSWENWRPCKIFGNRKSIRKRRGKCRLHPFHRSTNNDKMNDTTNEFTESLNNYFLGDGFDISCSSVKLKDYLPEISDIVQYIPEFEVTEPCLHNLTSRIVFKKKDDMYKYSDTKQIIENGHFTFICPEVSRDSQVEWYKNMKLLNSSFRDNMGESEDEPHLSIDSNILYILHATKNEESVYSCTVDGKRMQKIYLKVVSKSVLLNHEFLKYSCYLSFVLSLTLTCYCAGICVAWHRRSSFFDPLKFNGKKSCLT